MRYEFTVGRSCRVKTFLKEHDISKGLLAKIKFEGGHIWSMVRSSLRLILSMRETWLP